MGLFSISGTSRLISCLGMGYVQLWVLFWSLEERLRFQFIAFLLFPPPRHRQAVSLSIAILCHFPCWPSQILSAIILKSKKEGPFPWILPCIVVVPLSVSAVGSTASAMLKPHCCWWMGPTRAGCSSRGYPWSRHCPTTAL